MLEEQDRREIVEQMGHYEDARAACVEALKVVQKRHGWVPDEALCEVAEILGMTPGELDSVATFYSLIFRRPVGRHVILICNTVSCYVMGYEALLEHLRRQLGIGLGETTSDGRFSLLPVPCLGACDHAPALMIDDDLHLDVDGQKLDSILERYE